VPAGYSGKCVQSVSLRSGSKGQAFSLILFSVPRWLQCISGLCLNAPDDIPKESVCVYTIGVYIAF
jgi:hypothetical protein